MVEEGGGAGAELVSGAAGAARACVLSGADALGGGTGAMGVFVAGTALGERAGAGAAGASVEFPDPAVVMTRWLT